MPGRSTSSLANIAKTIVPYNEWVIYKSQLNERALENRSYSYSFETRKFYFAENPVHRNQLMDLYGDGDNPLNIIAIHDVYDPVLRYRTVAQTLREVIANGHIPFIGKWGALNDVCQGVSIIVNHGILDCDVLQWLDDLKQDYAARITRHACDYFPPLRQP